MQALEQMRKLWNLLKIMWSGKQLRRSRKLKLNLQLQSSNLQTKFNEEHKMETMMTKMKSQQRQMMRFTALTTALISDPLQTTISSALVQQWVLSNSLIHSKSYQEGQGIHIHQMKVGVPQMVLNLWVVLSSRKSHKVKMRSVLASIGRDLTVRTIHSSLAAMVWKQRKSWSSILYLLTST